MLLVAFVVAFGVVKGVLNFAAGRLSERIGRKRVLLIGWIAALPIPLMLWYAPSWSWVIAATVLLGVNQGLTWSMTQTAKLDLTRMEERGLTIGLNEFAGYVGRRRSPAWRLPTSRPRSARGSACSSSDCPRSCSPLVLTLRWVQDTLPWAHAESARHAAGMANGPRPRFPRNISEHPTTWEVLTLVSWRDQQARRLCARRV